MNLGEKRNTRWDGILLCFCSKQPFSEARLTEEMGAGPFTPGMGVQRWGDRGALWGLCRNPAELKASTQCSPSQEVMGLLLRLCPSEMDPNVHPGLH